MKMNAYFKQLGGHVHIRLFINGGKAGDICVDEKEFKALVDAMPGFTFKPE